MADRYYPYPLYVPTDGQAVWVQAFNFYSTPFLATYIEVTQQFLSSPNLILYPGSNIARWRPAAETPVVPVEEPFHAEDYNMLSLNASSSAWVALSTTSYGSYALSNVPLLSDGYIVAEYVLASPTNANTCYLGINLNNSNLIYNNVIPWTFILGFNGATGLYQAYYNNVAQGSSVAAVLDDRFRLRRSGIAMVCEYYRGGAWSVIHTFSQTLAGTAYMHIAAFSSSVASRIALPKTYSL